MVNKKRFRKVVENKLISEGQDLDVMFPVLIFFNFLTFIVGIVSILVMNNMESARISIGFMLLINIISTISCICYSLDKYKKEVYYEEV